MPCVNLRQDIHRHILHFVPEKSQAGISGDHPAEFQVLGKHRVYLLSEYLSVKRQRKETSDREAGQELPCLLFRVFPDDILRRIIVQIESLSVDIRFSCNIRDRDLFRPFLSEEVQIRVLYRFSGLCNSSVFHFFPTLYKNVYYSLLHTKLAIAKIFNKYHNTPCVDNSIPAHYPIYYAKIETMRFVILQQQFCHHCETLSIIRRSL